MIKFTVSVLLFSLCVGCEMNPDLSRQSSFGTYETAEIDGENIQASPNAVAHLGDSSSSAGEFLPVTEALLDRGEKLYSLHCTHCHGARGEGDGLISQHGFHVKGSNLHSTQTKDLSPQDIYKVLAQGTGRMLPVSHRLRRDEMWAVSQFVKVLQVAADEDDRP